MTTPQEAPEMNIILPEIVKRKLTLVGQCFFCREIDNETLEEQADSQNIEGLSLEQATVVQNSYVTMVCSEKMFRIIIIMTMLMMVIKQSCNTGCNIACFHINEKSH